MAHGLESRVPFLDHELIEFVATVPATVKFKGGRLKLMLKQAFEKELPTALVERRDKMGFPVPLREWTAGPLRDMVDELVYGDRTRDRWYRNANAPRAEAGRFSRKDWALLSLELWQRRFHDRAGEFRALLDVAPPARVDA